VAEDRRWVLACAAFAALRVLCSAALFPFFNNVDEPGHYDLVVKYSHGDVPRRLESYSREMVVAGARYASPEFLYPPESYAGRYPAPPQGDEAAAREMQAALWAQREVNKESGEPPLYYALAALWLRLGQALGLTSFAQLYWLRALNVVPAVLLVWLGHVTARTVFPESLLQRRGVPLLLAAFPQDTFYAITADVLSPLCFGLAYLGAVRFGSEAHRRASAAGTGLALAGSLLAKTANLPLIGVAGAALVLRARRLTRRDGGRATLQPLAVLLACAALPIGAWLGWNRLTFGDWLGTAQKIAYLGWTSKPLSAWWPHPLFSPAGLYAFWSELAASFWRGEFVWHGQRLTQRGMDVFYWASSAVLPIAAVTRLPAARESRAALVLAAWSFASAVAFQLVLSLAFDFGNCFYPSRERPFFTSGRLLGGALVPFLLLYVHGLDRSLAFTASARARWLALGAIALAVTVSELWLDLGPLASAYNALHLR
jgi:hypothetical protein